MDDFDTLVIGAGINGAVSAAALSARGLRVLLVDRGDFASFTSQTSSNMVWGGIKYLQDYEFGLVFKLCRSRARLMRYYPTQIRSIGFLASLGPNAPFSRPMGILGAYLYWVIGLFTTPKPRLFSRSGALHEEPALNPKGLRGSLEYFDGLLIDNDARFVYGFVRRAAQLGAEVRNYTEVMAAELGSKRWKVTLRDVATGALREVSARSVVNATGPFANEVQQLLGVESPTRVALSKGIHLTVRRIVSDKRILAFWDEQGRLFYVIPLLDRSIIGTTDTRVDSPFTSTNDEDRDFVLRQINAQLNLAEPLTKADIVAERSGVRPLVVQGGADAVAADWHHLTRKHVIEANVQRRVVTVFGGKLTDCLNVGHEVVAGVAKLKVRGFRRRRWFGEDNFAGLDALRQVLDVKVGDPAVSERLASGLWRRHGNLALPIAAGATPAELAEVFDGIGVCAAELKLIAQTEHVTSAEDLLRRRLPLALARSANEIAGNSALQGLLAELRLN
ncbi:MAG: hypothetical protein RL670_352 [Actinomycetota bacterium]